jgi:hypothetical protein
LQADVTEKKTETNITEETGKEIVSFQEEKKKGEFRFHTYKNDFLSVCPIRDRRRTYLH